MRGQRCEAAQGKRPSFGHYTLTASGERADGDGNSPHLAFANHVLADEALKPAADHLPEPELSAHARNDQAIAWQDGAAKPHVVEPAEADHLGAEQVVPLDEVAAELRGGFAHDDAGH